MSFPEHANGGYTTDVERRLHATEEELRATRRQLRRIRSSTSYRLADRLVRVGKTPSRSAKRTIGRVLRLIARVTPEPWRRALPPPVRNIIFRLTRGRAATASGGLAPPVRDAASNGGKVRAQPGLLGTRAAREGPVHVFVALGLDAEAMERLVREVVGLRDMAGGFLPVFVTDSSDFTAFRRRGLVFEYITAADTWSAHADPLAWQHYFDARLQGIVAQYAPRNVIVVGDGETDLVSGHTYLWPLVAPAE